MALRLTTTKYGYKVYAERLHGTIHAVRIAAGGHHTCRTNYRLVLGLAHEAKGELVGFVNGTEAKGRGITVTALLREKLAALVGGA